MGKGAGSFGEADPRRSGTVRCPADVSFLYFIFCLFPVLWRGPCREFFFSFSSLENTFTLKGTRTTRFPMRTPHLLTAHPPRTLPLSFLLPCRVTMTRKEEASAIVKAAYRIASHPAEFGERAHVAREAGVRGIGRATRRWSAIYGLQTATSSLRVQFFSTAIVSTFIPSSTKFPLIRVIIFPSLPNTSRR